MAGFALTGFLVNTQFAFFEIEDWPVIGFGKSLELRIGIHSDRVTHRSKHRQIIDAIAVGIGTLEADVSLVS